MMKVEKPLFVGNAQGFWGDYLDAPYRLTRDAPHLDFLTMDYLAELSLAIMAMQQEKDPSKGYADDFLESLKLLAPLLDGKEQLKIVTNAGGLNPEACAFEASLILKKSVKRPLKVAYVTGDSLPHLLSDSVVAANVYLGALPIKEALSQGADVVITGRVADPSLTVGPALFHFGWDERDYNALAGATVAGHLIECGCQVTGGCSTHWLDLERPEEMGFPIAEISRDGSFVITKPPTSSGRVTLETVKEQLLYEIGDPAAYLSPDVTASFLGLHLREEGKDRIHVSGAEGRPPPPTYKAAVIYKNGYVTERMLFIAGERAVEKAKAASSLIIKRLVQQGITLESVVTETFGTASEGVLLRMAARDNRKEALEAFVREFAPLVTSGPQGVAGYSRARSKVYPNRAFRAAFIARHEVTPQLHFIP